MNVNEETKKLLEQAENAERVATEAAAQFGAAQFGATDMVSTPAGWTSTLVIILGITILLFGLCIIAIMAYLITKGCDAQHVLRAFCVPTIIVAAIFLVVTGYNREQMTPVIGLLGTIAGYLLGTRERGQTMIVPAQRQEDPPKKSTTESKDTAATAE